MAGQGPLFCECCNNKKRNCRSGGRCADGDSCCDRPCSSSRTTVSANFPSVTGLQLLFVLYTQQKGKKVQHDKTRIELWIRRKHILWFCLESCEESCEQANGTITKSWLKMPKTSKNPKACWVCLVKCHRNPPYKIPSMGLLMTGSTTIWIDRPYNFNGGLEETDACFILGFCFFKFQPCCTSHFGCCLADPFVLTLLFPCRKQGMWRWWGIWTLLPAKFGTSSMPYSRRLDRLPEIVSHKATSCFSLTQSVQHRHLEEKMRIDMTDEARSFVKWSNCHQKVSVFVFVWKDQLFERSNFKAGGPERDRNLYFRTFTYREFLGKQWKVNEFTRYKSWRKSLYQTHFRFSVNLIFGTSRK